MPLESAIAKDDIDDATSQKRDDIRSVAKDAAKKAFAKKVAALKKPIRRGSNGEEVVGSATKALAEQRDNQDLEHKR